MNDSKARSSTDDFAEDLARTVSSSDGGRGQDYGHPSDNHGTTAQLWSAYLTRRSGARVTITARDVCMLNALQKISRDAHSPKRDNLLDLAGYAENADRIAMRDAGPLDARVADHNAREWRACASCDGGCVGCPNQPRSGCVPEPDGNGGR